MSNPSISILAFLVIFMWQGNVNATDNERNPAETTKPLLFNPLKDLIFNQNQFNGSETKYDRNHETLSRVKRQQGYGYDRRRYYPIPIFVGGLGFPAFGPRGFGRWGFGGRGFGRGFGGRGFGGRGIGGRGGIGGGRGGRG